MGPRFYVIIGLVVAVLIGVVAWTNWNRDNATAIAEGESVKTTVTTTDKVQGIKNEIRKRPVSDDYLSDRVLSGTW